jgi:hypothetical protein
MVERGEEEVRVQGLRGGKGIGSRLEIGARVRTLEGMEILRQDMVGIVGIEALRLLLPDEDLNLNYIKASNKAFLNLPLRSKGLNHHEEHYKI